MAVFYDNAITDSGRRLWADMQAGATFKATKIVIGSGYLPTGKSSKTMTAVAEPVATLQLNKMEKLTGGDFVFGAVFTNKDISTPFYYRELGLYAKCVYADGSESAETLYSYGNAGADAELIPAYSVGTAVEKQLDLLSYIGNDAVVTIEVYSDVTVSKQEFDLEVARLGSAIEKSSIIADDAIKNGTDTIVLTLPSVPATGTLVKFKAPCSCIGISKLRINDTDYSFVDAIENTISELSGDSGGVFNAGAIVSVVMDMESNKAFIQNPAKSMIDRVSEGMIVVFSNITVPTGEFVPDTTFETHPYRAVIDAAGITSEYIADVIFSPKDAISGILASVSNTGANCVMIYASEVPSEDVSILTIECRRIGTITGSGSESGGTIDETSVSTDEEVESVIDSVFS